MVKFHLLQVFQNWNLQEKQNNVLIEPLQFHKIFVVHIPFYSNHRSIKIWVLNNSKLKSSFQFQNLKLQKCKIVVSHQQLILHLTKEDGVIEWPFPMIRRSQMLNGWATPATKLATPAARLAMPSWLTGALVINPKSLLIAFLAWVWIHQTTGRILTQRSFSNSFMNYCYSQKQTR